MKEIRIFILILFATSSFVFCHEEPKPVYVERKGLTLSVINGVVQLNPHNFNEVVKAFDLAIVKFYAPGCGHCTKMAPAYSQLGRDLAKDEEVLVAEINTSIYDDFTDQFKIIHIPTLYLFHKGKKIIEYTGNKTAREMNAYLVKMKHLVLKPLSTIGDIEEVKSLFETCLIYFGDNVEDIKTFEELIVYTMRNKCIDPKIMKHYNVEPRTMVLFKMFDEKRNDHVIKDKLDFIKGSQFVITHSKPNVKLMKYEIYLDIFAYNKPGIILFFNGKDKKEKNEEYQKIFLDLARKVKEKLSKSDETIFTTVDITKEGTEKSIAKEVKITVKSNLPIVKIIDSKKKKNYTYKGVFTVDEIHNFITLWQKDELVPIQFDEL